MLRLALIDHPLRRPVIDTELAAEDVLVHVQEHVNTVLPEALHNPLDNLEVGLVEDSRTR
eukprot:CAMPEP_0204286782 /NCGR_PEP_ID=MMETSP0468-20130131/53418_1 /ASSEMBLY_ACC=CAM_ASM_000383 /TAXON_ID=2969 /ORGANISM="Oxyrrhis marina" /LENGTH=59 /DNA_ID=CAMNT_0051264711 /DNA_START=108 /DNA_END=284 /DNA_ORIENTATION=+